MRRFEKVLVANRGEIAVRIIRTVQAQGYQTVAVYSTADARSRHVKLADESICIGGAPVAESYLNSEHILSAVDALGADAVHPGYGFLAENAEFAQACVERGVVFIGPSPDAIRLMGSKRVAKEAALRAGVICIPGYQDSDQSLAVFEAEATKVGFPLMLKAVAGGGGRGMRLVETASALEDAIVSARREAMAGFGCEQLILEKVIADARHIEVQILADEHGNVISLGERDCSIQRRHQKIIEETPSPFVDETLRQQMSHAAVQVAKAAHYVGAGTVEFLVDMKKNFYFLEMNTRLQVEHPVTEMVMGIDLVAQQLCVAQGERLGIEQDDVTCSGHSIEARLYAEDALGGFLPQTGPVLKWLEPSGEGVRVDHGIVEGDDVSAYYDPMLAKVIAHGDDREQARRRLMRAVQRMTLLGVTTNQGFLLQCLREPAFARGLATTDFVRDHLESICNKMGSREALLLVVAAGLFYLESAESVCVTSQHVGWSNVASLAARFELLRDGEQVSLTLEPKPSSQGMGFVARLGSESFELQRLEVDSGRLVASCNQMEVRGEYAFAGNALYVDLGDGGRSFVDVTYEPAQARDDVTDGRVFAATDGMVVAIAVAQGDAVAIGDTLAVLEAMKMEHRMTSDVEGVVGAVMVQVGEQVQRRQQISQLTPTEEVQGA